MTIQHPYLASGRWFELTLAEQMGNVGSEVGRAARWRDKNQELFRGAVSRALELLDLTVSDPRWRSRLKEPLRSRELIVDALYGGEQYKTSWEDLDRYFFNFALAARKDK